MLKKTLRFTLTGLLAAAVMLGITGTSSASPASSDRAEPISRASITGGSGFDGEEYVKNCGTVSCTRYYTRAATKRINSTVQAQQNRIQNWGEAGPAVACAIAGAAIGAGVSGGPAAGVGAAAGGVACDKLSEGKIGSMVDALKQASEAGQCFAMRTPKVVDRVDVAALYASNYLVRSNEHCTDGA